MAAEAERVTYEPPSPQLGARMLALLFVEFPPVYAWLMGYAATGEPPSKPRVRKSAPPDMIDSDGAGNVRSIVGGGR